MTASNAQIPLGTLTILRAVVGSTVHGTNLTDQGDRDELGIAIEPRAYVIGLRQWETAVIRTAAEGARSQPGDLDLQIHSLRKFCRLAANGNPTILLPLFVPDDAMVEVNALGRELIAKRAMFLSRRCGESFLGYMRSQRGKLAGDRGGRHGIRYELIKAHGWDVKYGGHVIRLGLQGLELMTTGHLSLPMQPEHRAEVLAVRRGELSLERVLERAAELESQLEASLSASALPDGPDEDAIDAFLTEAYCRAWGILWHRVNPSPTERVRPS